MSGGRAYSKRRQFKFAEIIPWCQKINPFYSCLLDEIGKLRAKTQSFLEYLARRKYFLVFVPLEHFRWPQIFRFYSPWAKTQNCWWLSRGQTTISIGSVRSSKRLKWKFHDVYIVGKLSVTQSYLLIQQKASTLLGESSSVYTFVLNFISYCFIN